ncbi:MAG: protein kinase [Deltaproteobacteria bacterium]|nr:protein kinase [Deltaproteobacteria bacterium]
MNERVTIPGYRIVKPLATGGMGAVFEVEKLATRKRFAAKFLHEHLATEREYRLRFEREVGALCAVRHPHIVNIFGWRLPAIDEGGKPYILMELLHGEGLDQLLAREVALPPRRAISVLLQVLDGLAAAHQAGVIHRDLGPSNVFLTAQPHGEALVKLLDFGLAGPMGGGEARINVTQAGTVMGKPAYVAPEMFDRKPIDSRSDIFACGVLLFRMVSGRLPYREQESSLLWIERYSERQERRQYPRLRDVLAVVPEILDEACYRAMRRSPDDRFHSARAMQMDLLEVDAELARLAGETSESALSWSEVAAPSMDQPLTPAAGGATVAFAVAPSMDEPLPGATSGDTPLPRELPTGDTLPHLERPATRGVPIVIEPRKPPQDARMQVSTAWEVVPMAKPPSTPQAPRRAERSASSVIARSVPAGGRSFVMRPAVLAALVVLLALTVSLVVIFMRPSGGGGEGAAPPQPSFFSDDDPVLPPVSAPPGPSADASTPPTVPLTTPVAPPPAPDASAVVGPAPVDESEATAEAVSRIVLLGLPTGAAAFLDGKPFAGAPPEIVVPRSSASLLLRVTVPGYRDHESSIRPTGDMRISVPLERSSEAGATAPDAGTDTSRPSSTPRWTPRRPPPTTYTPPPRDAGSRTNNGLPLPENAPW